MSQRHIEGQCTSDCRREGCPDEERDYLAEALRIIQGGTMILTQKEHLLVLWEYIPPGDRALIANKVASHE